MDIMSLSAQSVWQAAGLSMAELSELMEPLGSERPDAELQDDESRHSPRTLPREPPPHILELLKEANGHLTQRPLCLITNCFPKDNAHMALREWYKDETVRTVVMRPAGPAAAAAAAIPPARIPCMACGPVDRAEACVLMKSAIATFERLRMASGMKPLGPSFTPELAVVLAGVSAQDGFHCSWESLERLQRCCPGINVAMALQSHWRICSPFSLVLPDPPAFCVLCGHARNVHCVHAARTSL